MNETLKFKTPDHYDIFCSYCASIISFGLEDTHSDEDSTSYRYLRCPNCKRKCITHRKEGNFMILDKAVEAVY